MKEKRKTGDWWLKYSYETFVLKCVCKEVCKNESWAKKCEFTLTEATKPNSFDTKHIQVDNPKRVNRVVDQAFRGLEGKNRRSLKQMKRFESKCK